MLSCVAIRFVECVWGGGGGEVVLSCVTLCWVILGYNALSSVALRQVGLGSRRVALLCAVLCCVVLRFVGLGCVVQRSVCCVALSCALLCCRFSQ